MKLLKVEDFGFAGPVTSSPHFSKWPEKLELKYGWVS